MPTNDRYPLVAIPKPVFQVLLRDAGEAQRSNPLSACSVNSLVQKSLENKNFFEYLLFQVSGEGDELIVRYPIGDPRCSYSGYDVLKKVRVTEEQFALLRSCQAKYARDGWRIPLSAIVTAMLWQVSLSVRERINSDFYEEDDEDAPINTSKLPAGVVLRTDNSYGVISADFFKGGEVWNYKHSNHLKSSSVRMAWKP